MIHMRRSCDNSCKARILSSSSGSSKRNCEESVVKRYRKTLKRHSALKIRTKRKKKIKIKRKIRRKTKIP